MKLSIETIRKKHESLISEYENYINKVVNSKIFYPEDREDCKQYVKLELIKLYKNKPKYPGDIDWKCVVKSAIRRRADDFRAKMLKYTGRYMTENRIETMEEDTQVLDMLAEHKEASRSAESLDELLEIVKTSDKFNEWDKEYIQMLLDTAGGDLTDTTISWYMGYDDHDQAEFTHNLEKFRIKIKEYGEFL